MPVGCYRMGQHTRGQLHESYVGLLMDLVTLGALQGVARQGRTFSCRLLMNWTLASRRALTAIHPSSCYNICITTAVCSV